ncbi:MAG: LLM class flavin-dependent oxidoreductase [Actinomycetota bacterium]
MEIGIGLPNAVPGTTGQQLTDWPRAADEAGFSSLGTIDRIVYPNYEPITALSAAAAVTKRIRLATTVLLGPLRMNAAMVAKQVLSLDALAGGGPLSARAQRSRPLAATRCLALRLLNLRVARPSPLPTNDD